MNPRILLLETSGPAGFVALARGPTLLQVRRLDETRRHARDLAPATAELLAAEGWKPGDVALVVIGRGPGSYTGLRVGLMSAKALAYATGCTLIALETFAVLARQAPAEALRIDVLADAQQDKIYVQPFVRSSPAAEPAALAPLQIQPLPDWLYERTADVWVTGPGLRQMRARLPEGSLIVAAERWDPEPEILLRLGLERFRAGERDDLWTLEPLYLRPSSAEEKWRKQAP